MSGVSSLHSSRDLEETESVLMVHGYFYLFYLLVFPFISIKLYIL